MVDTSVHVCVIGAGGFLGSAVAKNALDRGYEVFAPRIRGRNSDEDFWKQFLEELTVRKVHAVINCAAARLVSDTDAAREEVLQANRILPEKLALAASRAQSVFVQVGSRWQLGERGEGPHGFYAQMKEEGEVAAREICAEVGAAMRSVLIRDTYGWNDVRDNLIGDLIAALRESRNLQVTHGDQRIDIARVERVAAAIVQTALNKQRDTPFRRFETGTESPPTVREVIELFSLASNENIAIEWGAKPYRSVELFSMERVLPWAPGWTPDSWRSEFTTFVGEVVVGMPGQKSLKTVHDPIHESISE